MVRVPVRQDGQVDPADPFRSQGLKQAASAKLPLTEAAAVNQDHRPALAAPQQQRLRLTHVHMTSLGSGSAGAGVHTRTQRQRVGGAPSSGQEDAKPERQRQRGARFDADGRRQPGAPEGVSASQAKGWASRSSTPRRMAAAGSATRQANGSEAPATATTQSSETPSTNAVQGTNRRLRGRRQRRQQTPSGPR